MMNQESRRPDRPDAPPPNAMFCIHSYAGESGPPCGWRGSRAEAKWVGGELHCPRCRRATLMAIPPPPAG